ncbi:AAA family ATPase [Streptomyces fuscichromogenes]|uniref:AAA family ATPase n=1 Tax=Streptomyces fuscichromogenes TaxID=1324013 RepID=UPI00380FAF26
MEPIDVAHARFQEIKAEIASYADTVETEADTRLKVIDRVITEVLLWPYREILAEPAVSTGFVDYSCTVNDRSRLIIEAKKDGRSLGCEGRPIKRGFKLSGGVFTSATAKEGIAQAIRYCGEKNAELACVTNGREWVVFRGNRLGDGIDTREGVAFIFSSLDSIDQDFAYFYNLLSYEAAKTFGYRPYFQESEGQPIRLTAFNKSLRKQGSAKFLKRSDLSSDLEKVMSSFFHRLSGEEDPDLLNACFVETHESRYADHQLARISENIVRTIRDLNTGDGDALTNLVRRVSEARRHEFVVIVGTKGAGKSTFVKRFFNTVLPQSILDAIAVARVDLSEATGDMGSLVSWLNNSLLVAVESALFPEEPPSFNQIEGIFYDEYTRLKKGPWAALYKSDHDQFLVKFGDWVETIRRERPNEYIEGLLRYIVRSQSRVPVVVFDNADHFDIEFQQKVYQYARSIYEKTICLIVLPITDRTSWQLSKHGALQSFDHESLFLPTPATDHIIRKRIEFLEGRVEMERERPDDRYFVKRGIYLSIENLAAFTRTLQRVFLQTSSVSAWIGELANHDVRRALNIARAFATSPHLRVDDLLKSYLAGSAIEIPKSRAAKALIRGDYDIYPVGQHDYVQNVFSLNSDLETTPLLGVRLLQLLSDVPRDERRGALIDVERVISYFAAAGIEVRAINLWLDAMLKTGLCLSYDPTVRDVASSGQIEISPAGARHLFWARESFEYLSAMADVTPLLREDTFDSMVEDLRDGRGWRAKTARFLGYLMAEDLSYCTLPAHPAYESQLRLTRVLQGTLQQLGIPEVTVRAIADS